VLPWITRKFKINEIFLSQLSKFLSSFASSVAAQLKTLWNNQRGFKQALDSGVQSHSDLKKGLNQANQTKIKDSEILIEAMRPEFHQIISSLHFMNRMQIYNLSFESTKKLSTITPTTTTIAPTVTPLTCGEYEFFCSEFAPDPCIQVNQLCDGYNDCGDNKDEANCGIGIETSSETTRKLWPLPNN